MQLQSELASLQAAKGAAEEECKALQTQLADATTSGNSKAQEPHDSVEATSEEKERVENELAQIQGLLADSQATLKDQVIAKLQLSLEQKEQE